MIIPYKEAKKLIKDADILLFHCGKFPHVGWWISKYTQSKYSHSALAYWKDDELYCIEFREFIGSRLYKLDQYMAEGALIDVYRATESFLDPVIVKDEIEGGYKLVKKMLILTEEVIKNIIDTSLKLIGKKYSYWTIWQMFKTYIPFIRLRVRVDKNGQPDVEKFVCSTLITYAYRKFYIDPVPNVADSYTSPGDLARSVLFVKLFEIGLDEEEEVKEVKRVETTIETKETAKIEESMEKIVKIRKKTEDIIVESGENVENIVTESGEKTGEVRVDGRIKTDDTTEKVEKT
jgi:hypothetical protein